VQNCSKKISEVVFCVTLNSKALLLLASDNRVDALTGISLQLEQHFQRRHNPSLFVSEVKPTNFADSATDIFQVGIWRPDFAS